MTSSQRNRIAFKLLSLVGRDKIGDLTPIELYFHKINIQKQEYLDYFKIISPHLANLTSETRKKIYDTIWNLQFGEEDKEDKIVEAKTVVEEIRKQFKNLKDVGAKEVYNNQTDVLDDLKNTWKY